MPITSFTPTSQFAKFSTVIFPTMGVTSIVASTGSGVVTLTTAQAMQGLLPVDCQDAQSITTPTAALIVAAINGCQVGQAFDLDVVNYGDSTLTMALGTGVTKTTIAGVAAVLTLVTLAAKKFRFIVTNVTPGSEAVTIWAFGSTAAAVA